MQAWMASLALLRAGLGTPEASWEELSAFYRYQHPLHFKVFTEDSIGRGTIETKVVFTSITGQWARGLFVRPILRNRYPVVLLMHGLGGSKENAVRMYSDALLTSGCAVFALDAPQHGESQSPEAKQFLSSVMTRLTSLPERRDLVREAYEIPPFESFFTDTIHQGVLNYRLAIDYLQTRNDVRADSFGAIGNSMGAMMGAILGATDFRVKGLCMVSGGDPVLSRIDPSRPESRLLNLRVSPSLYIPQMSGRPILMLNGMNDTTIPPSTAQRLYSAAGEPKQMRWYASGHALDKAAIQLGAAWISRIAKQPNPNLPNTL